MDTSKQKQRKSIKEVMRVRSNGRMSLTPAELFQSAEVHTELKKIQGFLEPKEIMKEKVIHKAS